MTSNVNTTGEKDVRNDSVVRILDEAIAELNDITSRLTLSTRDDLEPVPNPTTQSPEARDYTSEFEKFCAKSGVDQPYPDHHTPFRRFLHEKALEPRSKDPEDYPGLQHAATLFLRDSEAEDGNNFDRLDKDLQDTLKDILNSRFADDIAHDRFVPGQLIGHGMTGLEWMITSQLFGVGGSFNRGIFQVEENFEPDFLDDYGTGNFFKKTISIMKTLPSPALDPGFASREISILKDLNHDNILAFWDGRVPRERHETGWMVTEFCNKGTLKNIVETYAKADASIPELFV
ncbi:hypothetical protein ACET3X_005736 [Alternaria dauci]|uniref:Protein kinase domain-containing protein n=1 Tax=Alternaria dauci TaxID=48095 RepID=A0ABR3UH18_9PLEO